MRSLQWYKRGAAYDSRYLEPFKADKRKVIGLGIELDEEGKGLLDWGITE